MLLNELVGLRLLADDLTGALDAAAPFARPTLPVRLVMETEEPGRLLTLSTETRQAPLSSSVARVREGVNRLKAGASANTIWFKKVDSALRGHPIAETVAMSEAGAFATCVFAPAFPAMGRVTINCRQYVRSLSGDLEPVGPKDLRRAFSRLAPNMNVEIINAQSEQDLEEGVARFGSAEGPILWVGSRGLSQAICGAARPLRLPKVGLFVLGTNHPVTRAQASMLVGRCDPAPLHGAINVSSASPFLLDPVPRYGSGAEVEAELCRALRHIQIEPSAGVIFVSGGDTLGIMLRTFGARTVECVGEVLPGLPLSRILGGPLNGIEVVSKSGGFGSANLLLRFLG